MNNSFSLKHTVNYSEVDVKYRLRFDSILSTFQKITFFHSTDMKIDAPTMAKTSNAFWVLCKSKFKINKLPVLGDEIAVETWPTIVSPLRFYREYLIKEQNAVAIAGSSEWCTFDLTTRAVRKTSTIVYPFDMPHRQDKSGADDFSKIKESVTIDNFSHTHVSSFTDIDANMHTNNVAYVRMALDTFSPEEFVNENFTEFEIYFNSQSFYKDEINVYRKKTDYGYYVEGKTGEKSIFNCVLKTE